MTTSEILLARVKTVSGELAYKGYTREAIIIDLLAEEYRIAVAQALRLEGLIHAYTKGYIERR